MSSEPLPPSEHIRYLDGLRGIAILLVVLYHSDGILANPTTFPGLAIDIPVSMILGGARGVDIFFFISGFALFYPYARHIFENRELQTLRQYAQRRIYKIIPSYWLALTVITIIFPFQGANNTAMPHSLPILVPHFLSHLFFVHNYSPETFQSINGSFWSLAVEVQFYILFPLIAWMMMRAPLLTIGILTAASISYQVVHILRNDTSVYALGSQVPAFFCLFGFGSLAAYAVVRSRNLPCPFGQERLWKATSYVSAFVLYGILGYAFRGGYWMDIDRELMSIALFFLTIGVSQSASTLRRMLESVPLVWLSGISYNLYLWHAGIFWWYRTLDTQRLTLIAHGSWLNTLLPYAMSIALAWAVTRWIEQPILRKGFGVVPRGFAYAASSTMAFCRRRK